MGVADRYETVAEGMADVFRYIEEYYDRKRHHTYLGTVSPTAFDPAECLD
jgi:hypothetical protein